MLISILITVTKMESGQRKHSRRRQMGDDMEKEKNMIYTKIVIRPVQSPTIGAKIYYQKNDKTGDFEPCIVESGRFWGENERISNAWTWLNLLTGKRESGYGFFLEIVEQDEEWGDAH